MRIKKVSCDQFAGINLTEDKEFKQGLNVVVGKNESGKSTLVDFIYNALFTPHDVSFSEAQGKLLDKMSFPMKADGSDPSTIEGSLEIDVDGKEYKVYKTWAKGKSIPSCKLRSTDGVLNQEEAEKSLAELLKLGPATYREVVFSSQRDASGIVKLLMDEPQNKSDREEREVLYGDLSRALSNAAATTQGISASSVEKEIVKLLSNYTSGWDMDNEEPKSSAKKDAIIRPIYDEYDRFRKELEDVEEAEKIYVGEKEYIETLENNKTETETKIKEYQKNSEEINKRDASIKEVTRVKEDLKNKSQELEDWPKIEERLRKTESLQTQLRDAEVISQFNEIKHLKDEYDVAKDKLASLKKVEESDIRCLEALEERIKEEERKLGGMDISIDITKLTEGEVSFRDLKGNEIPAKTGASLKISEPITISVGETLEAQLRPANIDPELIAKEIERARSDYQKKCADFGCSTLDLVENLKNQYDNQQKKCEDAKNDYEKSLRTYGVTWPEIQEKRNCISTDLEKDAVMVHVEALDIKDEEGLRQEISDLRQTIKAYKQEYEDLENLTEKIEALSSEKKRLDDIIKSITIPDDIELLGKEELEASLDAINAEIEEHRSGALLDARAKTVDKNSASDYRENVGNLKSELEEAIKVGKRWKDIQKKFIEAKEKASKMDVTVLRDSFIRYIQILTSDEVSVEELSDGLNLTITSGKNRLSSDVLSNGTRETIELAFRLAMLDELFPEGDGFAIFDDPLVNMDPDRRQRSCELLKEFAKKNQVIFMTCHPEYIEHFGIKRDEVIEMA